MDANEAYLNDHMSSIDRATHAAANAAAWKADYIEELLTKGSDLYPWTMVNVIEALENRKTSDELFLGSCVAAGCEDENSLYAMNFIGKAIKIVVHEYWKDVAVKKADKDYEFHCGEEK